MTAQLDLLRPVPGFRPLSHFTEREEILAGLENKAGRRFQEKAAEFVLVYLAQHGPSSGEDMTDACKKAGIEPYNDDRAFGAVYMGLARAGKIAKAGYCERRKGHGTSGGNVWEIRKGKVESRK